MTGRYLDPASHLLVLVAALTLVWMVAAQPRAQEIRAPGVPALSPRENHWLLGLAQQHGLQPLALAQWQAALKPQTFAHWQIEHVVIKPLPAQPADGLLLSQIEAAITLQLADETVLEPVQQWLQRLPGVLSWTRCQIEPHAARLQAECVLRWSAIAPVGARR
ncbi:hypothetical protein [Amantichitinum ursilacus]|uniref:Uncharacterized protein n=1 Tax=Amantichitinum ursilacus TaxID=857265 RepID=A0A0N0XLE8_9NEIS|nr:hypothetical protein [Amantichitinum ursilacus]KPC54010.1 hypothetical protein WG78_05155 [Amantichitinum ursilacus]